MMPIAKLTRSSEETRIDAVMPCQPGGINDSAKNTLEMSLMGPQSPPTAKKTNRVTKLMGNRYATAVIFRPAGEAEELACIHLICPSH